MHQQPNNALWKIAAINFLIFAVRGLTLPFVSLYLIARGFSATEIGALTAVSALAQLLLSPALNALADRVGRHRQLFYIMQIGHILACVGMIVTPYKLGLGSVNFVRDFTSMPSVALLSQLTITWLDERRRAIYGRVRAWGSLGWSTVAVLTGGIIAVGGYPLLFVLAALVNLLMLPLITSLPERTGQPRAPGAQIERRSAAFYLLLASLFLFFIGFTALTTFGFVYFRHELGASDAMIGLIASLTALAEIPAMVLFERFQRRASHHALLIVGVLGQAAQWLVLSLLMGSSLLIPVMLLRGTFFTLQMLSATLLVARISHPANVATNQALAQVTIPGLAVLLTGPIAGWIFDNLGPRILFQIVALLALCGALLLIMARRRLATPTSPQFAAAD